HRRGSAPPAAGRLPQCCAEPPRAHPNQHPRAALRPRGRRRGVVLSARAERNQPMKKNILVSVDRSETRVAVLEAKGSPAGGQRRKKAGPSDEWKVADL